MLVLVLIGATWAASPESPCPLPGTPEAARSTADEVCELVPEIETYRATRRYRGGLVVASIFYALSLDDGRQLAARAEIAAADARLREQRLRIVESAAYQRIRSTLGMDDGDVLWETVLHSERYLHGRIVAHDRAVVRRLRREGWK